MSRPSFLDAYLVTPDSMGSPAVGAVRKDRTVWRPILFGTPATEQPAIAFATREEAGQWLLQHCGSHGPCAPEAAGAR